MRKYDVIDPSLRSVSQGESVYPVVDGVIELPAVIASDLIATGQIAEHKEAAPAPAAAKSRGKKAAVAEEGE